MKKSKSLRTAYDKFDRLENFPVSEAIKMMLDFSTVKFDPTAEIHFTLGVDPRHADQQVRSTVSLPHGTGKKVNIVVFCPDEDKKKALDAGAIEAGETELIEKISKGWTDFDVAVATPDMMRGLAKIARVLGPKGLMPNPKAGTITPDFEKAIKELAAGRLEYRNDKNGIIHTVFGKLSFGADKLSDNLSAMIKAVQEAKPSGVKGTYIETITINSTMGPGIRVSAGE